MVNKEKIKKHLKRVALGLAAGAALASSPGAVGAVKNVKKQSENRKAQEYNDAKFHQELDAKRNEMAKKIQDAGIKISNGNKTTQKEIKSDINKAKIDKNWWRNPDGCGRYWDENNEPTLQYYGDENYQRLYPKLLEIKEKIGEEAAKNYLQTMIRNSEKPIKENYFNY